MSKSVKIVKKNQAYVLHKIRLKYDKIVENLETHISKFFQKKIIYLYS